MIRYHLKISGRVQGVGYRYFTETAARKTGVTGWVRNLPDGRVEAEIQGTTHDIIQLLSSLRRGPTFGRVSDITKYEIPVEESEKRFEIRATDEMRPQALLPHKVLLPKD